MLNIKEINEQDNKKIRDFIIKNWYSTIMISKGKIHQIDKLPGFIAIDNNSIVGLITYDIVNKECEIVSLDSLIENEGCGTKLIEYVIEKAKIKKCKNVWLITTNDNTKAIRFYQKRGFIMSGFYYDSIKQARKIKKEIPIVGMNGIKILSEIELRKEII